MTAHNRPPSTGMNGGMALARALGWFSIGLGAVELLAPERVRGVLGAEWGNGLVRAYGLREIAAGVGILASENPRPWILARVAGDVLDVATLAPGLRADNGRRGAVSAALCAVAAATIADVACARLLQRDHAAQEPFGDHA